MRLRRLIRKLKLSLAGLVGGFAFACSGPTNPGEMPPLAPRPEPVQPVPGTDPRPLPGAPDPLDPAKTRPTMPDAGAPTTRDMPAPQFRSSQPQQKPPVDAGVTDAVDLPPVPDSLPGDANRKPESAQPQLCC